MSLNDNSAATTLGLCAVFSFFETPAYLQLIIMVSTFATIPLLSCQPAVLYTSFICEIMVIDVTLS
jgi:hypothetical protein